MQHRDGGWGWWEYDDSDVFLTALVLDGIDRAASAGYPTKPSYGFTTANIDRALKWLAENAKKLKSTSANELRDAMYSAYVLGKHGRINQAREVIATHPLTPLGAQETAYAALAHHMVGDSAKRDEAITSLERMAEVNGPTAHWREQQWAWGEENTGIALGVLALLRPESPLIDKAVAYLMHHRDGTMWSSTRSTSYALIGLSQYMSKRKAPVGESDIQISVNGKLVKTVHVGPAEVVSPDFNVVVPIKDLQASNSVEIKSSNGTRCFASLSLRQVDTSLPLSAKTSDKLSIERKYYVMEARPLEDGTLQLLPSKKPIEKAKSGDIIRVELTIDNPRDREFIMIEDPTPSNCRVTEREVLGEYEEWMNWWSQTVVRDDRTAFFSRFLNHGVTTLTYSMRAERIGVSRSLPATIMNMYDPSQVASSSETAIEVTR
jgi:uncharacterized protein YfaS (alpha-2-macroglobulin family)